MLNNSDVINIAKKLGFHLVGFAKAEPLTTETMKLEEWLHNGYEADMGYMQENFNKRKDVTNILPSAKSVISLALNYHNTQEYDNKPDHGKVSRYAWGRDYHNVIWEKLDLFYTELNKLDPEVEAKGYVDTGPVMDKVWAVKSGLGWQGKHTNVINKNIGSWFFITTVLINREFNYSTVETDHCGSCTACIDSCPTNAITPYSVNANKCISYLTIENKGDIPQEYRSKFNNWLFGCDICQDVCPWNNKFATQTDVDDFLNTKNKELPLNFFEGLSNRQFNKMFNESPISRARAKGMRRNAEILK